MKRFALRCGKMTRYLKAARSLICDGWTQKALARTGDDRPISPFDQRACAFCAVGAIMAARGAGTWETFEYEIELLTSVLWVPTLSQWNDAEGRTVKDIIEAFDMAIREHKRRESTAKLLMIRDRIHQPYMDEA